MLHQLGHPDYPVGLLDLQNAVAGHPQKVSSLLTSLSKNGQNVLALDWAKQLPSGMTEKWPVVANVAQCHAAAKDWTGLEAWCRKSDWGPADYIRHATLARALREQGSTLESRS